MEAFIAQLQQLRITAITLKSFTDAKGSVLYNRQLSKQRNDNVLQALQKQLPASIQYHTVWYGEDSLLSNGDDKQQINRRTEVIVFYKNDEDSATAMPTTELVPYKEDVPEQRYEIDLNDTVSIAAKQETKITFAPGTFQLGNKEMATGKATLLIKEYYQPSDILLSGMHSLTPNGLLQTGGMFTAFVVQNNDTMMAQTLKPVSIKMPDIGNSSNSMNVFTTSHGDTGLWNDTRKMFNYTKGQWNWPDEDDKLTDFYVEKSLPFYRWKIGRVWSEEYSTTFSLFAGRKQNLSQAKKSIAKFVSYTITKKDSSTLSVHLSEKFRRCGYKKFLARTFDTTFLVCYSPPFYKAQVSQLNFINCDRFINSPQVTNFFVKTPGFKGAKVMVYFKKLNAYMPAIYKNHHYEINKVPAGEEVCLVAVGNKESEFYYGKSDFTISEKATAEVEVKKVHYDEMKQMFEAIGYKK